MGESSSPPVDWCLGRDVTVVPLKDEAGNVLLEENLGENHYMAGGPTCHFRGKDIPAMFFISPSGGVTAEILVEILKRLDKQEIYSRNDGVRPMIILDGHDSRLKPTFLNYINSIQTKWYVCLGTPYSTGYWQVGDSAEQNGAFKMAWICEKLWLNRFK